MEDNNTDSPKEETWVQRAARRLIAAGFEEDNSKVGQTVIYPAPRRLIEQKQKEKEESKNNSNDPTTE